MLSEYQQPHRLANKTPLIQLMAHELGHTLGLVHFNSSIVTEGINSLKHWAYIIKSYIAEMVRGNDHKKGSIGNRTVTEMDKAHKK